MSTGMQRRRRHVYEYDAPAPERSPGRGRARHWLLAVGLALPVLIWLLPILVAHSPLFSWAVASATADLQGSVSVGSASLGWFSPIELRKVEVRDAQGLTVLTAPSVKGRTSLISVLLNTLRPGDFRIEKPELHVVLRKDKTNNLDNVLAKYVAPSDKPSAAVEVGLEVVDGVVIVTDESTKQEWKVDKLQLLMKLGATAAKPLELAASGTIVDREKPGGFDVRLKMNLGEAPRSSKPGQATSAAPAQLALKAANVPLVLADLLTARFAPDVHVAGRLDAVAQCQWGAAEAGGKTQIAGTASIDQLVLNMPSLQADQLTANRVRAVCKAASKDGRLEIEQLSVDSDALSASLVGAIDMNQNGNLQGLDSLLHQTFELKSRVDLQKLAGMLPGLLHIHKDTRITSGELRLDAASRRGAEGMAWEATLRTSDLTAMRHGKELVWQQPILVTLSSHESKTGPVLDKLSCDSHFLRVDIEGTQENLAASASFDLDRLAERLGGFVDLNGLQMAGNGWANLSWKRSQDQQFAADGELQIRNLKIVMANAAPWEEENLRAFLSASGRTNFNLDSRLDTAELEIRSGMESITTKLLAPLPTLRDGGIWPVSVDVQGDLARWIPRLRPWIDPGDSSLAGQCHLNAKATASRTGLELRDADLTVQQLDARVAGFHIAEPQVQLTLSGRCDYASRRVLITQARLNGTALSLQADQIIFGMPESAPLELAGNLQYRGDLAKLQLATADPAKPPDWRLGGALSGTARLTYTEGMISGQMDATVENLLTAAASGRQYFEPRAHLIAQGAYQPKTKVISLQQMRIEASALAADAKGRLSLQSTGTDVDLAGQVAYDLDKLSAIAIPYLGNGIQVVGRGSSPVDFRGPLGLDRSRANAGVNWTAANIYGFQIGHGQLQASLADGILNFDPISLAVSQGRLNAKPRIRFAPAPAELLLDPGPLLQQVRIDPQMCSYALQYIAPVLAGVASAEGQFSIELDRCRVPLTDPGRGDLSGRFIVHSVQIGPGPMVQQLATLLGGGGSAKLTRESKVQFRLADGRVYHEGLEMAFPQVTVRTHGWVGLDHTMNIEAEMPIPQQWLARAGTSASAALRNQTIRVPVAGTLERPQVDRREFDRLNQQFVRNAAQSVIEGELNKQFNRLLGPRK